MHQSKYNVKCRDSALFSYNSLEASDNQQEIGASYNIITNDVGQIKTILFSIKFASSNGQNTVNGLTKL